MDEKQIVTEQDMNAFWRIINNANGNYQKAMQTVVNRVVNRLNGGFQFPKEKL